MNKNSTALILTCSSLILSTPFAFAGIEYTSGNHHYVTDSEFGYVLKIGYGGPCSGTVKEGEVWEETSNILIGCCPNNYEPTKIDIYGTANTSGNVYVGGDQRAGYCTVDAGQWNCGGLFQLGVRMTSSLTLKNGGTLTVNDGFSISYSSTATISDNSSLRLTLNSSGEFGENGGIHSFFGTHYMNLDSASNLVIDAGTYSDNSDKVVLKNLFTARTKDSAELSGLQLTVGGETFNAGDEAALNKHLSGIKVEGFENYTKSFVLNESSQTVDLHLSKIPEPSAFGLLAGLGAIALAASRRRRSRR